MFTIIYITENIDDSTTNIREIEKILKAKIKNLRENLVKKRRTIEQYVSCKTKHQEAETFHGFFKEIEESLAFTMLTTYGNFTTLQNCLKEQIKISENIKELDDLIAKKYMNMKSFNNGLFMYELAARNVDELIPLAKKIGGNANEIFSLLYLNNQLFCAILCSSLCQVLYYDIIRD
ncbi:unnamed protein product [Schistosoma bovis]|nr:unnamed protein product [Schistosoma bovis]